MAHRDECETCRRLEDSEARVEIVETEDPSERRFVAHPWPVTDTLRFATASEADGHPLARALWRGGTVEVRLDPEGATVLREDPRAWPFYAEGVAVSLQEQLALL